MPSNVKVNLTIVLSFLCIFLYSSLSAQKSECGFDAIYKKQMADPVMAPRVQAIKNRIGEIQKARQQNSNSTIARNVISGSGGSEYQIPVVVHIVHRGVAKDPIGSTYNPSDETIESMIVFLNSVYAGTNTNGGVSTPIRFVLAKRDPNCQSTNGIVRVDASADAEYVANGVGEGTAGKGISDASLKSKSRWPVNSYYNIWIVWKIWDYQVNSSVNGYAYYPGAGDQDGTVMIGNVANGYSQTLAHEIGHAMGLYHTFQGVTESNCGSSSGSSCSTTGDEVCDTDPHQRIFNCPTSTEINPCSGTSWGQLPKNIMGYFNCKDRFTPGQATRLLATMLAGRYTLANSLGAVPLPSAPIPPIDHTTTIFFPDNTSRMGPVKVTLQNLVYESEGYSNTDKIAYLDKTCVAGTSLDGSVNQTIVVKTNYNRQTVKVWLDLNNNGTFETNELMGVSTTPSDKSTYEHNIVLPSSKLNASGVVKHTPLRLRVAADYSAYPNFDFDDQLRYGQMVDFAITLTGSLPVTFSNVGAVLHNDYLTVNWKTLTEKNNNKYLVQVSPDGQTFYTIDEQLSKAIGGNSDSAINYEFSYKLDSIKSVFASLLLLAFISFASRSKRNKRQISFLLLLVGLAVGPLFNSCNKKTVDIQYNSDTELYVRIVQIDNDGTIKISKVVKATRQ